MTLMGVVVVIETVTITTKITFIVFFEMNKLISEISALNIQMKTTAAATLLYVTSSWYLR